jgi:hypothetical protein
MMIQHMSWGAGSRTFRLVAAWLALCLFALAGQAAAALSVSPASVSTQIGLTVVVKIAGAKGELRARSSDRDVATVSMSDVTRSSATLKATGKAAGSATVTIRDGGEHRVSLPVKVSKPTSVTPLAIAPTAVTLPVGTYSVVAVTGAVGGIQAVSNNTSVATVTLSNVTGTGATLNVMGKAAGSTSVKVTDTQGRSVKLSVTVTSATTLVVSPTSVSLAIGATSGITASNASGAVSASSGSTGIATVAVSGNLVTVKGIAAGSTLVTVKDIAAGSTLVTVKDSKTTLTVPVTVTGSTGGTPLSGKFALLAWNDLGMHCMDGKDYSMFSILPPFNNLHAQLVNATTGKAVTTGVTLTYEAVADPSGSINTTSAGKTNFWSWAKPLYGATPAADVGLTGFSTPSRTAKPMVLDAVNGWFEATGVPITPYDDNGAKNFYPTVKVTALDSTGKVLATATTVLPVSDEMTCSGCHASRPATETNVGRLAARPAAGWVNDANAEIDWKKNILRLHDEKQATNPKYVAALATKGLPAGLYASALAGTPSLCASCHASNALPGTGIAGISALTSALHTNHARAIDPVTMLALDASTNRSACYACHPGSETECLRGAMGNVVDANGSATMGCQSCHGKMSKVGDPARVGWLQQPNCQACHFDGKRTLSAVDAAGNLIKPADTRFATNPNVPAAGYSLFRVSKGHGGMQCESCHGATHAEYPSSHVNDNLQSMALQGHAGTVRECTLCHASLPDTVNGGPHGMHSIGATWVSRHGDLVEGNTAQCTSCHGADYRGSPLAQMKVTRTFGSRTLAAGKNVGCYDCHNGPNP